MTARITRYRSSEHIGELQDAAATLLLLLLLWHCCDAAALQQTQLRYAVPTQHSACL